MRLKPGIPAEAAVAALRDAAQELHRALQLVGEDYKIAIAYVRAVSQVERLLRANFIDVQIEYLRTQRFWAINALQGGRLIELINDERELQVARLDLYADQLRRTHDRVSRVRTIGVVDTHVLLHYRLFDEVDWPEIMSSDDVLLVVPLRVVDELDEKKAARREDIRDRARTVIRHLEQCLDRGGSVRDGVRVDVLGLGDVNADAFRQPPLPPDVEILDLCEAIVAFVGNERVKLISRDLGMRIRARDRGLHIVGMPEELELGATAHPGPDLADERL